MRLARGSPRVYCFAICVFDDKLSARDFLFPGHVRLGDEQLLIDH